MEVREPVVAYNKRKFTIAEYLEMETSAVEKSEYYKGEIFAMSGAEIAHNIITRNTFGFLLEHLKEKKCQAFGSDLRVFVEANTLFTYPDISVFCSEVEP